MRSLLLAMALVAAGARPAFAQTAERPPRPHVSRLADGIVVGTGVALTVGASLLPVDGTGRWESELLSFDDSCRGIVSASADRLSDASAIVTLTVPAALQTSQGFNAATAERLLVYAETLSVTGALGAMSKFIVARPRPYTYSSDPRVAEFAARQGNDTHLSFFSGHSAVTFAAAVSGSFLFTQTSNDRAARATVWGTELYLAGLTAGLRVRAGRHFPTDVATGIVVGTAVGVAVPALHYRNQGTHRLSVAEAVTAGISPVAGLVTSALLPFERDVPVVIEPPIASTRAPRWALVPWATRAGVGMAAEGRF